MRPRSLFVQEDDSRLEDLHDILLARYGPPEPREIWPPLRQFIYSILSPRTKTVESLRVLAALWERYGSWESLRDAPVGEIQQSIQTVTFADVKALRLKRALEAITARYGSLTLDFLAAYKTRRIRIWLERFDGIGPKASAAVVCFSTLRRRAMCLDAHHLRVVRRLKLVPVVVVAATEARLMEMAPESWDAAMLDDHHSLVKLHGQTLCTFHEPLCRVCPLLGQCPTGQARKRVVQNARLRTVAEHEEHFSSS